MKAPAWLSRFVAWLHVALQELPEELADLPPPSSPPSQVPPAVPAAAASAPERPLGPIQWSITVSDFTQVVEGKASLQDVITKETANLVGLIKAAPALKNELGFLLELATPVISAELGSNLLAQSVIGAITAGVEQGLAAA